MQYNKKQCNIRLQEGTDHPVVLSDLTLHIQIVMTLTEQPLLEYDNAMKGQSQETIRYQELKPSILRLSPYIGGDDLSRKIEAIEPSNYTVDEKTIAVGDIISTHMYDR